MKRATTMKLVTAAVWLAVCAAVLQADAWEPLAGLIGVIALLLATVALGLVLRWWAVLVAPIGFVLAAVVVRPGDETYDTFWLVFVLVPVSAVVAAIAAFVARWVDRPQPASVLVAVAAALVAVGLVLDARTVDHHPQSPVMVNLDTGALPNVRPGADAAGLRATFGKEIVTRDLSDMAPLGHDGADLSGPGSLQGDFEIRRFDRIAVFVRGDTVVGYVTTDRNVELGEGVGVADSLSLVENRGLPLTCSGVTLGSDSTRPAYRVCQKRLPGGAFLIAGGDPIDSVWVVR
ncbi:MAG: hypothetical protein Q8K79_05435 [Solirubrobacteraceae bacterium]|nr:hypothetical protein [Solirubrobacteraceae bacterium]